MVDANVSPLGVTKGEMVTVDRNTLTTISITPTRYSGGEMVTVAKWSLS